MLLLFILFGVLALGLPLMLMLFGTPPALPPQPVIPKPAIVLPTPAAAPIEVPQATATDTASPTPASTPATTSAETPQAAAAAIAVSPSAAPAAASPSAASPVASASAASEAAKAHAVTAPGVSQAAATAADLASIPGLPEGTKLPSEAELMKELQRLLEELKKATRD